MTPYTLTLVRASPWNTVLQASPEEPYLFPYIFSRNLFGRSCPLKSMKLRSKRYSVYTTSFVVTSPTSYYLGFRWLLYMCNLLPRVSSSPWTCRNSSDIVPLRWESVRKPCGWPRGQLVEWCWVYLRSKTRHIKWRYIRVKSLNLKRKITYGKAKLFPRSVPCDLYRPRNFTFVVFAISLLFSDFESKFKKTRVTPH